MRSFPFKIHTKSSLNSEPENFMTKNQLYNDPYYAPTFTLIFYNTKSINLGGPLLTKVRPAHCNCLKNFVQTHGITAIVIDQGLGAAPEVIEMTPPPPVTVAPGEIPETVMAPVCEHQDSGASLVCRSPAYVCPD